MQHANFFPKSDRTYQKLHSRYLNFLLQQSNTSYLWPLHKQSEYKNKLSTKLDRNFVFMVYMDDFN